MARPTLPDSCRWAGTDAAPCLMSNYAVIAYITPATSSAPMRIHLNYRGTHIAADHRGGLQSARRFIERWVSARLMLPHKTYPLRGATPAMSAQAWRVLTAPIAPQRMPANGM